MLPLHPEVAQALYFARGRPADSAVWHRWSDQRIAELWQALVLLCAVDPDSLTLAKAATIGFISWRLELAEKQLDDSILMSLRRKATPLSRSIVRLDVVRAWAESNLIWVPDQYPVGGWPSISEMMAAGAPAAPQMPVRPALQVVQADATPMPPAVEVSPAAPPVRKEPKARPPRAPLNADSEFMREADLLQVVPFSRATLWRRVKDGTFPAPVKLSASVTAWRRADYDGWAASHQATDKPKGPKRS